MGSLFSQKAHELALEEIRQIEVNAGLDPNYLKPRDNPSERMGSPRKARLAEMAKFGAGVLAFCTVFTVTAMPEIMEERRYRDHVEEVAARLGPVTTAEAVDSNTAIIYGYTEEEAADTREYLRELLEEGSLPLDSPELKGEPRFTISCNSLHGGKPVITVLRDTGEEGEAVDLGLSTGQKYIICPSTDRVVGTIGRESAIEDVMKEVHAIERAAPLD